MTLEAIFLDRDGVINRERADYVKSVHELVLLPGVLTALSQLVTLECPVIVVTNQSCVGRGIITANELNMIHGALLAEVTEHGGRIDKFYVCPHHPEEGCDCRKPQPGLLRMAAIDYGLNLRNCVFVGDSITDYQAAKRAGCPSILVRSGRQGTDLDRLLGHDESTPIVSDLSAAVELLLEDGLV